MNLYNSTFRDLVDEHAPLRTNEMPRRPLLPRYNREIRAAKRHGTYREQLWIRTSLHIHYEMFKIGKIQVTNWLECQSDHDLVEHDVA